MYMTNNKSTIINIIIVEKVLKNGLTCLILMIESKFKKHLVGHSIYYGVTFHKGANCVCEIIYSI